MQNNHDHNLVMISNLIIIIIITVAPPLHPTIDTCSGDED